jgi:SAM-dependent methyltransferase
MSYLQTIYSEQTRPKTIYPVELAHRLKDMFQLKDGARLLDVGCGRGDFAAAFVEAGLVVDGVDWEKVEGFAANVTFTAGDISGALPYADNTFDVVFSKSVIEHMDDVEHFVKENMRVLKPSGRLICMTPDWITCINIFYDDHTHKRPFTVTGMRDLLRIVGVKDVSSEIFYQLPVLWRHPWLIIFSKILQLAGPVKKLHKNKFVRWSRELMVIGTGIKG